MTKFSPLMMSRSLRLLKHLYRDFVYTTKRKRNIEKIKLVAVARNEAAYLPEWIFHHLYFGFCEIDIYVNNSTDNSLELKALLGQYPVNIYDADEVFKDKSTSPQIIIYKRALKDASKKFDALMFLDIDEFWIPSNFSDTILSVCRSLPSFDTVSFQWKNKLEKKKEFSRAIEREMEVDHREQVKTLFKTYLNIRELNPHNTSDAFVNRIFEDGTYLQSLNYEQSRVKTKEVSQNAFILHRMNRSEREYIAMLMRGRPIGIQNTSNFKDNRFGFQNAENGGTINVPHVEFLKYDKYMRKQLENDSMQSFLALAREEVLNRYWGCLQEIRTANETDKQLLFRLLSGVTLSEVTEAYNECDPARY